MSFVPSLQARVKGLETQAGVEREVTLTDLLREVEERRGTHRAKTAAERVADDAALLAWVPGPEPTGKLARALWEVELRRQSRLRDAL